MTNDAPLRDSYDRLAEEYARRVFSELQHKPLDRELLNRFAVEVKGEVCDIGSGPGHGARHLYDAGASVFGLDFSPGMLEQARRLNPDILFREGDMTSLSIKDGILAGIVGFYAIVNFPKASLPLVFREMERVLQPGGLLLLAFHSGDEVVQVNELWGLPVSMEFFFFQSAEIQRYLKEAGLVIEETIERDPYPEVEYPSRRGYIFARKPATSA